MKKNILLLVLCSTLCLTTMAKPGKLPKGFHPDSVTQCKLVECTPRGGLPNFFKKIRDKQPEIKVAYIGGSITAHLGYRLQSCELFQMMYPEVKFTGIDAALGGTGSSLGVFRVWHDVIRNKPDLVFVEFAVNDSGANPRFARKNMEGIVRQIWMADPTIDIIFVYTVTAGQQTEDALNGLMCRSASIEESLAGYYDIPSINFAAEVAPWVREGKMVMKAKKDHADSEWGTSTGTGKKASERELPANDDGKVPFAPDGVHPYHDTGHVLYTRAIEKSLPILQKKGKPGKHKLPKPVMEDCVVDVSTVMFDDPKVKITGPYTKYEFGNRIELDYYQHMVDYYFFEPGAEISFKFQGQKLMLYDMLCPEGVILDVSIDGQAPKEVQRFDPHCSFYRLHSETLIEDADPNVVHDVRIKVTDKFLDKYNILSEGNRHVYDEHPDWFQRKHLMACNLFMIGKVVE